MCDLLELAMRYQSWMGGKLIPTIGKNKSIPIEVMWILRCVLHDIFPQSDTNCGHTHSTSRVTALELLAEICNQASESLQDAIMNLCILEIDMDKLVRNAIVGR